ncbi:MAG: DUF1127 domain-containing protein [Pseudomonadota bacterium]
MPAITAFSFSASALLARALNAAGAAAIRVFRAAKNRHSASMLARLDDRMLADIGLTRSDLRDAYAEPLWEDPTTMLARRAAERRMSRKPSRKRVAFENSAEQSEGKFSEGKFSEGKRPSANRPACYLT